MDGTQVAPEFRLDGKVAWITGASRGLGRSLALGFARAGASVLLSARSADGLNAIADEIRDAYGDVEVLAGSIADRDVVASTAELAQQRWGRLDVLVNNAGISTTFAHAEHITAADWQHVLDINLSAPLSCAQAALPLLEAAGTRSVVNISSALGTRPHARLVAYAASKGGLEMMTRTLALEWAARNIRVNSVAPGYLETDMTTTIRGHDRWRERLLDHIPMRRFGTVGEVVPAVMFLASDASAYITSSTLFVDGGWAAFWPRASV